MRLLLPSLMMLAAGCSSLLGLDEPADDAAAGDDDDGGSSGASGSSSGGSSSSSGASSSSSSGASGSSGSGSGGTSSSSGGSSTACETLPLPCLDANDARVVEVPTESTFADALAGATAGDTIQLRGGVLPGFTQLPANVTFRGCEGAQIQGPHVDFKGSAGTVEGFRTTGAILARNNGDYTIRHNVFSNRDSEEGAAVALATNSIGVPVTMTLHVEGNWFEGVHTAVVARTDYFNATRSITLDAKNNVFVDVERPFYVSEGGTGNHIDAAIAFNTMFRFTAGVTAFNPSSVLALTANVFASGTTGVSGSGPYTSSFDLAWQLGASYANGSPAAGDFLLGDPKFVDAAAKDFHLGADSAALDLVSAGYPATDYEVCGRPRGTAADVGAFER